VVTCLHALASVDFQQENTVNSFFLLEASSKEKKNSIDIYSIGGFHVTQVSLIIAQVENKIAYHLIN